MNCQDFLARLHEYVDGELGVEQTAAANQHSTECRDCGARLSDEHAFRQLLRRQPQEAASAELQARIAARLRTERRRRLIQPWLIAPLVSGALAAVVVIGIGWGVSPTASVVGELVDKHKVFAQVNPPPQNPTPQRPPLHPR